MSEYRSERPLAVRPSSTPASRAQRLACAVAEMITGAVTAQVSHRDPAQMWPSPYLRAYDASGQRVVVTRAKGLTAARWVIRAHPEADWTKAHDFDLATGALRPASAHHAADEGR
ncbi:hypothetical protein [Streptomyces sp. G1]|uniref:hypothetical protein n=1 Tax=Streptomyces sp. G1 TaxID=361572 RepID=UPI002030715A|nr:hypothetical protein [Streptomyces sp. G1]MCM1968006.1 hypothetical protein [Streptomyces sp. G1]